MNCHCQQSKTKRKADYRATSALIARSEWLRLTPEEKAEIERLDKAHAEWVEKWNNMSFMERFQHSIKTSNERWREIGEQLAQHRVFGKVVID